MVVDDDPFLQRMVAAALKKVGYNVATSDNGESAWELICSEPLDLLITDYSMPRLNGIELLRRLRNSSLSLPAILMSASMTRNLSEIIEVVSPGGALHKPFGLNELYFKVGSILDLARLEASSATLDATKTSREVLALLRRMVTDHGLTVCMVTHDPVAAGYADRVVFLSDGRIVDQLDRPGAPELAARMAGLAPDEAPSC